MKASEVRYLRRSPDAGDVLIEDVTLDGAALPPHVRKIKINVGSRGVWLDFAEIRESLGNIVNQWNAESPEQQINAAAEAITDTVEDLFDFAEDQQFVYHMRNNIFDAVLELLLDFLSKFMDVISTRAGKLVVAVGGLMYSFWQWLCGFVV